MHDWQAVLQADGEYGIRWRTRGVAAGRLKRSGIAGLVRSITKSQIGGVTIASKRGARGGPTSDTVHVWC